MRHLGRRGHFIYAVMLQPFKRQALHKNYAKRNFVNIVLLQERASKVIVALTVRVAA